MKQLTSFTAPSGAFKLHTSVTILLEHTRDRDLITVWVFSIPFIIKPLFDAILCSFKITDGGVLVTVKQQMVCWVFWKLFFKSLNKAKANKVCESNICDHCSHAPNGATSILLKRKQVLAGRSHRSLPQFHFEDLLATEMWDDVYTVTSEALWMTSHLCVYNVPRHEHHFNMIKSCTWTDYKHSHGPCISADDLKRSVEFGLLV